MDIFHFYAPRGTYCTSASAAWQSRIAAHSFSSLAPLLHFLHFDRMPDNTKPNPPRPVLTATEAQLFVADVAASCAFYKDKLGFAVEFAYGDPPFYALVVRDRARLTLRGVDEPVFIPGVREREGLLSASLTPAT